MVIVLGTRSSETWRLDTSVFALQLFQDLSTWLKNNYHKYKQNINVKVLPTNRLNQTTETIKRWTHRCVAGCWFKSWTHRLNIHAFSYETHNKRRQNPFQVMMHHYFLPPFRGIKWLLTVTQAEPPPNWHGYVDVWRIEIGPLTRGNRDMVRNVRTKGLWETGTSREINLKISRVPPTPLLRSHTGTVFRSVYCLWTGKRLKEAFDKRKSCFLCEGWRRREELIQDREERRHNGGKRVFLCSVRTSMMKYLQAI